MRKKYIQGKDGNIMDRYGNPMFEFRLEPGDEFIPLYNNVLEKEHEAEVKGETKTITRYLIQARARDKDKNQIQDQYGKDEIFITLTPTQANSLKKKADEGIELNQNIFIAFNYESQRHGMQVGVGQKNLNKKKAKTFEELEAEASSED